MNEPLRPASLNDSITGITRLLMAARSMNQTDLARALGVDKAIITRSFAGTRPWKIEDVEALADLFDVSPTLFFKDPEALIREASATTWYTGLLPLAA